MKKNKLKIRIVSFAALLLILLAIGCEDVIHVDLNSVAPRLVIEAYITDNPGYAIVALTRSTDYYNPDYSPLMPADLVTISDEIGNVDTLSRLENGA